MNKQKDYICFMCGTITIGKTMYFDFEKDNIYFCYECYLKSVQKISEA